jgi:hypothetical protein
VLNNFWVNATPAAIDEDSDSSIAQLAIGSHFRKHPNKEESVRHFFIDILRNQSAQVYRPQISLKNIETNKPCAASRFIKKISIRAPPQKINSNSLSFISYKLTRYV